MAVELGENALLYSIGSEFVINDCLTAQKSVNEEGQPLFIFVLNGEVTTSLGFSEGFMYRCIDEIVAVP